MRLGLSIAGQDIPLRTFRFAGGTREAEGGSFVLLRMEALSTLRRRPW